MFFFLPGMNGLDMCGLTNPTITYLIEQLRGAHRCHLYEFRFHRDQPITAYDDDVCTLSIGHYAMLHLCIY